MDKKDSAVRQAELLETATNIPQLKELAKDALKIVWYNMILMKSIELAWMTPLFDLVQKHERHLTSAAFLLGFIWDTLTLHRIDLLFENLVFLAYLLIATLGIITYHARPVGYLRFLKEEHLTSWLPFIIQFAFGGLFSGYIIFYSQSASLWGSWPFLALLAALFIGNETFRKRYEVLTFQLSVLFVAIFSYTIFSLPVLLEKMGLWIFILSGFISLIAIVFVAWIVFLLDKARFRDTKIPLLKSVAALYIVFNLAYFTNIIPPIPLALKELGVYHHVERLPEEGYRLTFEEAPWYRPFDETSSIFNRVRNAPVYAFSSVFAPTKLETTILHRWSYYDEEAEEWAISTIVGFPIVGGRDGGYRGFSMKNNLPPGLWRVDVITEDGLLIGRMPFRVVPSTSAPTLIEALR
jgi:hypothetical protein